MGRSAKFLVFLVCFTRPSAVPLKRLILDFDISLIFLHLANCLVNNTERLLAPIKVVFTVSSLKVP